MLKIFFLLAAFVLSQVQQNYQPLNAQQYVINVTFGSGANATAVNLLVDLQATGLLLFTKPYTDGTGAPLNNAFLNCTALNICTTSTNVVSWISPIITVDGLNYTSNLTMQGGVQVNNLWFVNADQITFKEYTNWTNIAGVIGASSSYLAQYFNASSLGFQQDANFAIAGWNPAYNSSIQALQYFYFGSYVNNPNATEIAQFQNAAQVYGSITFGSVSDQSVMTIMPDFQYFGVPSSEYNSVMAAIIAGGINASNRTLSGDQKVMVVTGSTCQTLTSQAAYSQNFLVTVNNTHQLQIINASIPLSSLMATVGSDCYIQIYTSDTCEYYIGQAFLQSFQLNINYTTSTMQFSTTALGSSLGAVISSSAPVPAPPAPTPSVIAPVNSTYLPINGPQLVVSIGVGTAPYTQQLNLLVTLLDMTEGILLFGSDFANNSYYSCGPSCTCNQSSVVNWDGPLLAFSGIQCLDTVYMNSTQIITDFQFGFQSPFFIQSQVIQLAYQNLTNIAGLISASSPYLTEYFGQASYGFSQGASASTWSWSPYYDPAITSEQFFLFGENELNSQTPNWVSTSDLNSVNLTFGDTLTNQQLVVVPEFQYIGVSANVFLKLANTINALGMPVVPYVLDQNIPGAAAMWVSGQTCQSFQNTSAFNETLYITFYNTSQSFTTFVSLPLSSIMETNGGNCYVGIYQIAGVTGQIWAGQALLQSFVCNFDNTTGSYLQFSTTVQGRQLGANVGKYTAPVASQIAPVLETFNPTNVDQLTITISIGTAPNTQQLQLLVSTEQDIYGMILFGSDFGAGNSYYSPGPSSSCNSSQFISAEYSLLSFFGVNCTDTLYMPNSAGYTIPNFSFGYQAPYNTNLYVQQYQYINFTGIAGIISANTTFLQQYFGARQFQMNMSPNNQSLGWNYYYNDSLTQTPYFYFGGYFDNLTSGFVPVDYLNNVNVTFDATISGQQLVIYPEFQYVGVNQQVFTPILNSINALGIPAEVYYLSETNSQWQIMWVNGTQCQNLNQSAAYHLDFSIEIFNQTTGQYYIISVPLNLMMTTEGNSCFIGIYNQNVLNSGQIWLGQAFLQFFDINSVYDSLFAKKQYIQFQPTQLGDAMSARYYQSPAPVSSTPAEVTQPYVPVNGPQLAIQVGVGTGFNIQQLLLLVTVDENIDGMLLFGQEFAGNDYYIPGPSAYCNNTLPVDYQGTLFAFTGIQCYDTVFMSNDESYVINNFPIGFAAPYLENSNASVVQFQYQNFTNIAGLISANSVNLLQYFGADQLSFSQGASSSTWSWSPYYNPNITTSDFFIFGGNQFGIGTPHFIPLNSTNSVNITFDGTLTNQKLMFMPDFEFMGVPTNLYLDVYYTLNNLGIPATPYSIPSSTPFPQPWRIMWINGTECQNFVNTTAFNQTFFITASQNDTTTGQLVNFYTSIPLSSIMTNSNGSCFIGLYDQLVSNSGEIWLGQAFLQSFTVNVDYTNQFAQFYPTTQGRQMGANVQRSVYPNATTPGVVTELYEPINGPQLVIQVGVGQFPNTQMLNLLVATDNNFAGGMALLGKNYANNQIYSCGPSCFCNNQLTSYNTELVGIQGVQCTDTVYMGSDSSYIINNFPIVFAAPFNPNSQAVLFNYVNMTNIAGIINVNSTFLQDYFGQSSFAVSMDASNYTWSWSPYYNPSITQNDFFKFGGTATGSTTPIHIPLGLNGQAQFKFGNSTLSANQNISILPEFQYLGVPSSVFNFLAGQIGKLGIPVTPYNLDHAGGLFSYQAMWVQGSTCQSFQNQIAFNQDFFISFYNSTSTKTYYVNVPLSSMMTTIGNDCYVGIYNIVNSQSQIWLGQAFLQSFTVNIDYEFQVMYFKPTSQGAVMGAGTNQYLAPVASALASQNVTYTSINRDQLVVVMYTGSQSPPVPQYLLVDLSLDSAGALLFAEQIPGLNNAVYECGFSCVCNSQQSVSWNGNLINFSGINCTDTLTIKQATGNYVIPNFQFGLGTSITLNQYTNLTGISGIISANALQLTKYFGSSAYQFSQAATSAWSWNPNLKNVTAVAQFFDFGSNTPPKQSVFQLNRKLQQTSQVTGSATYGSATESNQVIMIMPDFQYLGVSNTFYNSVKVEIQSMGISTIASYTLGTNQNIMYVPNRTCQTLTSAMAYSMTMVITQSTSSSSTSSLTVPLSNMMTTVGADCLIGIYNIASQNQIWLGQSYLQSFIVSANPETTGTGDSFFFSATPQAVAQGATADQVTPSPSPSPNKLSAGAITGIVLGSLAAVALIVILFVAYSKKMWCFAKGESSSSSGTRLPSSRTSDELLSNDGQGLQ